MIIAKTPAIHTFKRGRSHSKTPRSTPRLGAFPPGFHFLLTEITMGSLAKTCVEIVKQINEDEDVGFTT
jgi:hypothetical protein